MAYGSPEGVAALARTWTIDGEFLDPDLYEEGTNPTLERVEEWLDQVSVIVDLDLANHGFTVPVSHIEVKKAIDLKVNAIVADLVHLVHSKGRLFSDRIQESGVSPQTIIERDLAAWIKAQINAFEAYGIPRIVDLESMQAYSIKMTRET